MAEELQWRMDSLDGEAINPIYDESLARWNDMVSRETLERPVAEEEMLDPYADQLLDPGPIELEDRIRTQAIGDASILPQDILLDPESYEQDAMINRIQEIGEPSSPHIILLDQATTSNEAQVTPSQETGVPPSPPIAVLVPVPTANEQMMETIYEVGEDSAESPLISYQESASSECSANDIPPPSPKEVEDKFRCKLCSKEFDSRKRFTGHAKVHFKFQCPNCPAKLKWRKALIAHCLTFHPDKSPSLDLQGTCKEAAVAKKAIFACGQCGKAFRQSYQLQRHEWNHTGEKPFPCPQCPLAFNYRHLLKRHLICCTRKLQKVLID